MTTIVLNTKLSEVENKILKYDTTLEFNRLTAGSFASRLKHVDFVNKTDFDNKLMSFKRRIISNKIKHLEVQKKLKSRITKYQTFFLGRHSFTSNDWSQNTFVDQPALDTLELKKDRGTGYVIICLRFNINTNVKYSCDCSCSFELNVFLKRY